MSKVVPHVSVTTYLKSMLDTCSVKNRLTNGAEQETEVLESGRWFNLTNTSFSQQYIWKSQVGQSRRTLPPAQSSLHSILFVQKRPCSALCHYASDLLPGPHMIIITRAYQALTIILCCHKYFNNEKMGKGLKRMFDYLFLCGNQKDVKCLF
ncbi:AP-5 complex subunit zeta-1 [Platysternon megacephalum]|uniref:AP-5 complex subunit zeta-1 n=1 Tax=Platysternon megacephalum TaxID=55544 RepID=A0A4D9EJV6_9SAUR|nr:AP-5 complex subunit zeta-1 [Platysternon megacephalum]